VMALGEADIFEVVVLAAGAHAFLRGSGLVVVALFEAEEDVLELVHPGVGEEQGGIAMRDERRAAHAAVVFAFKEAQKSFADVVAGPKSLVFVAASHVNSLSSCKEWIRNTPGCACHTALWQRGSGQANAEGGGPPFFVCVANKDFTF
jgi:hypothetical protein